MSNDTSNKPAPVGTPWLHDYSTGDKIREATVAEMHASEEAEQHDSGAGIIIVDGRACYVVVR